MDSLSLFSSYWLLPTSCQSGRNYVLSIQSVVIQYNILVQIPEFMFEHVNTVTPVLLKTLSDHSDEVSSYWLEDPPMNLFVLHSLSHSLMCVTFLAYNSTIQLAPFNEFNIFFLVLAYFLLLRASTLMSSSDIEKCLVLSAVYLFDCSYVLKFSVFLCFQNDGLQRMETQILTWANIGHRLY